MIAFKAKSSWRSLKLIQLQLNLRFFSSIKYLKNTIDFLYKRNINVNS